MLIICNQAKRDDEGIVPYGDIGGFCVFLSSGIIATGKISIAVQCVVYIKTIICNQTKRNDARR